MKRKIISIVLLSLFITIPISCSNKKENIDDTPSKTETIEEKTFVANYSGETYNTDINTNIPFMAIVENAPDSRPQSGLSEADVIYETSAEGNIPRFMAIFHSNSPDKIGPIRSVRPYFINLSKSNRLPFAHCGGSEKALNEINNNSSIMSINEIPNGEFFWRYDKRKAPHNLYTSSEKIRDYIKNSSWAVSPSQFINFDDSTFKDSSLNDANNLRITLNKYYSTNYVYKDNLYYKYMDDELAVDANNDKPLAFSNIVIQKTNISLDDDKGHLKIKLVGNGDGFVLSQGKYIPIKWSCDSEDSKTYLYDTNEKEISLSPGKTIWHIIDSNTETLIE